VLLRRHTTPIDRLVASRIVIIKPSALGDVVHALPVLGALRDRFPNAHIAWIVNRAYQPLIDGHPCLNETIPFDRSALKTGWRRAAGSSFTFARLLRRKRFDLVVDLQGLARSGLMSLATGAERRIGLSTAREGARLAYTDIVTIKNPVERHAIDHYWDVATALGAGSCAKEFNVPIRPDAQRWAAAQLADCPRPWMVFGVGARWLTKRWPPTSFAELANRAFSMYGGTVVFVGAPDEKQLAAEVASQLRGPFRDFVGATNLNQLAALLDTADVMIANDTGPLHLAVALGRPAVAPYTCTSIRRHGPYGQPGGVETAVFCKGSYVRQCDRMDCMSELRADRLWPVLSGILQSWTSRSD
jgi:heptosyltransferase I